MRRGNKSADPELSKRERQIMDVLFAVRTILRVLDRKGFVRHFEEGLRYVYEPTVERKAASRSALQRIIRTFFDGSAKEAVAALLDPAAFRLTEEELKELGRLVERAKVSDRTKKERK